MTARGIYYFEKLKSIIRRGSTDETVHFVKYSQFENEKELTEIFDDKKTFGSIADENNGNNSAADTKQVLAATLQSPVKEAVDRKLERNRITAWQAGWNVTNAIQGMFIVSFPYTVVQGGYWALVSMIVVAYICCHTGKILVECLYEVDSNGYLVRVRHSYVDIAEEAMGKRFGGKIVNVAQLIELLMTCILYVLLSGELIQGSFPDSPISLTFWIMIATTPLLSYAFLKSLRGVSWLSFWCTMAHMAINAFILIFCFTRASEWQWRAVQVKVDVWTFPISIGIVVFSYTSQIFLPTLEENMEDRSRFHCMLHWTHIAAAFFKVLFSYICFLTWGNATQELITNNLPTQSLKIIVNLILVAKSTLSYPLPYYAAVEMIQTTYFNGKPSTYFPSCFDENCRLKIWAGCLRIGLVLATMVMAIFIPHFAILMGLIGSFTGTMLSFVWPCLFHIKIKGKILPWYSKVLDCSIIIIGVVVGSIGIYYSFRALSLAFRGIPTTPFHARDFHKSL
ncbi:Hypothetical predicted protein [Argonauta hians]